MRDNLKQLQPDPIEVERLLQGRGEQTRDERAAIPREELSLEEAVARMTEIAERLGSRRLVLSAGEWQTLVQHHLGNPDITAFSQEIIDRAGGGIDDPRAILARTSQAAAIDAGATLGSHSCHSLQIARTRWRFSARMTSRRDFPSVTLLAYLARRVTEARAWVRAIR